MKDGKPESLAEALLLLEKMNARLSEKEQKIREQQVEIQILNEKLAVKRAREFADNLLGSRIVLIDGTQLTKLMIKHDLGVSVEVTYELKRIDSDYFSGEF